MILHPMDQKSQTQLAPSANENTTTLASRPEIPPSTNEITTTLVATNPFFPTGKGFSPLSIGVTLLGFLLVVTVLTTVACGHYAAISSGKKVCVVIPMHVTDLHNYDCISDV